MKVLAAIAALFASVSNAASTGEEIFALRDDIRGLCMRLYTVYPKDGKSASYWCRYVNPADSQRHVINECWKSGWSGQGNLQCKYGVEPFHDNAKNDAQPYDRAVHPGAAGSSNNGRIGRRRMQEEDDSASAGNVKATEFFHLENLTDDAETIPLGGHAMGTSFCVLQGMEVIPTEDPSIVSACNVKLNEDKKWVLDHTSAMCHTMCFPWN